MSERKSQVIERYNLSHTILEKKLSDDLDYRIALIISRCAPPQDHDTREATAKRIRELIISSKTEAEIIEKIQELEK